MTGFQSKKKSRHADEITLDHLIKLRTENERLREALKPFSELFYYPDDFGEYTSKSVREDEDWNEEANDEETSDYFIKRLWIKKARAALKGKG